MKTGRKFSSLFLCILLGATALGCSKSGNGSDSGATLDLTGSKQGLSVGFADVDGDGIADKIVGAPYATTTESRTGAVLVYKGSATGFSTNSTPA